MEGQKRKVNLCIIITVLLAVIIFVVFGFLVCREAYFKVRKAISAPEGSADTAISYDRGDTSAFTASGESVTESFALDEETAEEHMDRISDVVSGTILGSWYDQYGDAFTFEDGGKYSVAYEDGSSEHGAYCIQKNTEFNSVTIVLKDSSDLECNYSIDVINDGNVILWSYDADIPDLNLRKQNYAEYGSKEIAVCNGWAYQSDDF